MSIVNYVYKKATKLKKKKKELGLRAPGSTSALTWLPSCSCRALVFVSHGAGEHSGRYDEIAQMLVGLGLLVFAHDHGE